MISSLKTGFEKRLGRAPTPDELSGAIQEMAENEILYREGVRWRLEKGDPIVRRRVIQKMQFLLEDSTQVPEPTEEALREYHRDHHSKFVEPARSTFEQRFFSLNGGEQEAREKAEETLRKIKEDGQAPGGEPFLWGERFEEISDQRIDEIFGNSMAVQMAGLAQDIWSGPLRSTYGMHLVRVIRSTGARDRTFEECADDVYRAFMESHRVEQRRRALEEVTANYDVVVETGDGHPEVAIQ